MKYSHLAKKKKNHFILKGWKICALSHSDDLINCIGPVELYKKNNNNNNNNNKIK